MQHPEMDWLPGDDMTKRIYVSMMVCVQMKALVKLGRVQRLSVWRGSVKTYAVAKFLREFQAARIRIDVYIYKYN